jgi:ankyrin repeat protein
MIAASAGLVNNVRALILAGAEINTIDNSGKSALALAVDDDHKPVVRLLRSLGAEELRPKKETKANETEQQEEKPR